MIDYDSLIQSIQLYLQAKCLYDCYVYYVLGKIMNIIGGILVLVGLFLGLVALVVMLTDGGGTLACITSIATMSGGTLLFQEAQRPTVFPLLRKAIRRDEKPQA